MYCSWQFSFQFIFSLSLFYFRLYPLVHLRAVFLYFYAYALLIMTIGLTISSIALKAIEGIVRLHTPHKLQVCVQPLNIWLFLVCLKMKKLSLDTEIDCNDDFNSDCNSFYGQCYFYPLRLPDDLKTVLKFYRDCIVVFKI